MNTEHHMLASAESAHFVSSSPLIALVTVSAESQTPVGDAGSSSGTPLPSAFNDNNHFDINMTTVILIIVCLFPVLGVFVFYVNRRCAPHVIPPRQPDVDRVAGQKNQGLDPEFIETFPVVSYSTASMAKHSTDCAVCLTEFQEGERTRLLPRCNHAFHPECIDMWLFSHSTCPLCRIVLISESHAITILSNPPQLSARQEDPDGAVPVIEMGLEAPSEAIVERAREREAVLSGSRSSQSCPQAASEMDNGERLLATSATHSSSISVDERSPSSRWIGRLRRSCSMEGSRSSAKEENPDYCREPSAKE